MILPIAERSASCLGAGHYPYFQTEDQGHPPLQERDHEYARVAPRSGPRWGSVGGDALRRSAFKEAMAHLGKAIALADESEREPSGLEAKDQVLSKRRLRLHTDYGHAAMWLKGFAADEMSAAYARAGQFAGPTDEAAPRFVATTPSV